jgi:hypothetical protein
MDQRNPFPIKTRNGTVHADINSMWPDAVKPLRISLRQSGRSALAWFGRLERAFVRGHDCLIG